MAARSVRSGRLRIAGRPTPDRPLPIQVEVWSADTTVRTPRLTIAFEGRSTGPVNALTQSLGLSRLEPGRYRLRVSVRVAGRDLVSEAWFTVGR